MRATRALLVVVGAAALTAFSAPAGANPFYHDALSAVHRLVHFPPDSLSSAQRDSLILLLGSGGADDMRQQNLDLLEGRIDRYLPLLRLAQLYPNQPSLRLQRLIRHHGSSGDCDAMQAFLRTWLTAPPDSIYSRPHGAAVKPPACTVSHLQVIAAEALVEYADPAADSLIATLLRQTDDGCTLCPSGISDRRLLELARFRLKGSESGYIMRAGEGDTLHCVRDLAALQRAQLFVGTTSTMRAQGVTREALRPILECLASSLQVRSSAAPSDEVLDRAEILVTLHFEDGLQASLAPFGGDRVRYQDDSCCHGVYLEFLDARLNAALRALPHEMESSIRMPRAAQAR